MVYDGFQQSDLVEACAELTVWQREGLKTHMLGGIRLSYGTGENPADVESWIQENCIYSFAMILDLLLVLNSEIP